MAIITISRGSYSKGKETAEKVAKRLGYECIGRDLLIDTSKTFSIPEIKLIRALHDAPSVLDRFTFGKERYICFIKKQLLSRVQKDNVVYHGLAGHYFLKGVPHVLKVRIIANLEDRVKEEMKREGISEKEARRIIVTDDLERRKWGLKLYGIDTADPSLYDLVIHIDRLQVDDAVDIICNTASRPCFETTEEAKKIIDELSLAASIEAMLINDHPRIRCKVVDGVAHITVRDTASRKEKVEAEIRESLRSINGIKDVCIHLVPLEAVE